MNDKKTELDMELLSREEAADYLKICLSTLDKLINAKNFYGKVNIGRRIFIDKNQLNRYLLEQMY